MGGPPKSILAISDLTLGGSTDLVPTSRLATPSRAFCSSGTDGSNPVPSSGESDELRIRPPPNLNKASSNRSRRRGYGAAGSGPRA
jgi:hypothetical protein